MNFKIKPAADCYFDELSLGEIMLRLDPGGRTVDVGNADFIDEAITIWTSSLIITRYKVIKRFITINAAGWAEPLGYSFGCAVNVKDWVVGCAGPVIGHSNMIHAAGRHCEVVRMPLCRTPAPSLYKTESVTTRDLINDKIPARSLIITAFGRNWIGIIYIVSPYPGTNSLNSNVIK